MDWESHRRDGSISGWSYQIEASPGIIGLRGHEAVIRFSLPFAVLAAA
jgi:hypothetical protein